MKTLFSFLVLSFGMLAQAGELTVAVQLSPAGSFEARSSDVRHEGNVTRTKDNFVLTDVAMPLESLHSGISLRDKHMHQKYFETKKYPEARLTKAVGKEGRFAGLLKIRNVTKKVTGTYEWKGSRLVAVFKTRLSDFKIQSARYLGLGVKDEVEVAVDLNVEKKTKVTMNTK